MGQIKRILDENNVLETEVELCEIHKRAALKVARELGYSQMCIEDINRSTSPYMVDDAMAKERRRKGWLNSNTR